jgi:hypothetical protein
MSTAIKSMAVLAIACIAIVAELAALRFHLMHGVEIRGTLSSGDVAEINRLHRLICPVAPSGFYPKWVPVSLCRQISAVLNPIEIIAVPADHRAIIVYRGYDEYRYDFKGRHRWGLASYKVAKDTNGWHVVQFFP